MFRLRVHTSSATAVRRNSISDKEESTELKRRITGFHRDDEEHWVAELECGHRQHVRHHPPLITRPWVLTPEGRQTRIGAELDCKRCDETDEDSPIANAT